MPKKLVYKKPSVSSTTWSRRFHNATVEIYDADEYRDFYKVVVKGQRPKYFFGETAWMDAQRLAMDSSHHRDYYDIYKSL